MEIEEKANIISKKYLNNCKVIFKIEQFDDRTLSRKGWQYKKYGNSTKGSDMLKDCRENMELMSDDSKCARNDSDLRYYEKSTYMDNNNVIQVSTSPSRSGNTCSYTFFIVSKI